MAVGWATNANLLLLVYCFYFSHRHHRHSWNPLPSSSLGSLLARAFAPPPSPFPRWLIGSCFSSFFFSFWGVSWCFLPCDLIWFDFPLLLVFFFLQGGGSMECVRSGSGVLDPRCSPRFLGKKGGSLTWVLLDPKRSLPFPPVSFLLCEWWWSVISRWGVWCGLDLAGVFIYSGVLLRSLLFFWVTIKFSVKAN